jgi:hypothetical protein
MKIIKIFLILALTVLASCVTDDGKDPDVLGDRFDEDVSTPLPSATPASAPKSVEVKEAETISNELFEKYKKSVDALSSQIEVCYKDEVTKNPKKKWSLWQDWDIDDQGKVILVSNVKNDSGNEELGTCVAKVAQNVVFPPAPKDVVAKFKYRYTRK